MIENRHLVDALVVKAKELGVDLRATAVSGFEQTPNSIAVTFADGEKLLARLLVGADGARSQICEQAGIVTHGWNYDQSAIVTTVGHERDHNGRAEEHFLPAGPFAILPLTGNRSSIVWTESKAEAERMIALPDQEFHRRTGEAFRSASRRLENHWPTPRLSAWAFHRARIHRRAHRAGGRRRAHHSPDRRAGPQYGLARCRRFGGSNRRRGAARARYRRGGRAGALPALAAFRHHDHGRCHRRPE